MALEILPMAEPYTKIIIIGTLQREDDIYSVNWEKELEGSKRRWISKTYDAILSETEKLTLYPEKWDWEQLMTKRNEIISLMGSDKWFLKEYRNMPVNLVGEIVKSEQIQGYDELPPGDYQELIGWDLSVGKDPDKGDWTVGIHLYRNRKTGYIYIDWIFRARVDFNKRLSAIQDSYVLFPETTRIGVENVAFQYDSVQVLIEETSLPIKGVKTTTNKIEKFNEMLVPLFGNKKVFIKNGIQHRQEFVNELLSLPRGEFDDMADALCVALGGLKVYQFSFSAGEITFNKDKYSKEERDKIKPGMMPEEIKKPFNTEEERKKLEREADLEIHRNQIREISWWT